MGAGQILERARPAAREVHSRWRERHAAPDVPGADALAERYPPARRRRAKIQLLGRLWIAVGRVRFFVARVRGRHRREDLVRRLAPGKSWADIGCMWGVHGELAFLAEESGATSVTGVDVMEETEEYRAEHARRGSRVRFVQGDMHDPATVEEVGRHDVVWCTGVLCNVPNPQQTLQRLREMTGELLIVDTMSLPEVPGIPQASVFYPGLSEPARDVYRPTWPGVRGAITRPFDPTNPAENWWWGLTPSAMRGLLFSVGFEVVAEIDEVFQYTVVCRPRAA